MAQENVKKVEEDETDDISEPEDPLTLQRDAKDWKVATPLTMSMTISMMRMGYFN